MRAITFVVHFQTAQFKDHLHKLVRKTYLIPLPSSVAGLLGAILGVYYSELKQFCRKSNVLTGAIILGFEGYVTEYSRMYKMGKDIMRTIKDWYRLFELSAERKK